MSETSQFCIIFSCAMFLNLFGGVSRKLYLMVRCLGEVLIPLGEYFLVLGNGVYKDNFPVIFIIVVEALPYLVEDYMIFGFLDNKIVPSLSFVL